MKRARCGFTMAEIVVVVVAIGVLAAVVVPKFASAQSNEAVADVAENILAIARGIEFHRSSNGYWPADVEPGMMPPEVKVIFKKGDPFIKPCSIGGVYDYSYVKDSDGAGMAYIRIHPSPSMPSLEDALELDKFLDDGVLNTGRFRADDHGYAYRMGK